MKPVSVITIEMYAHTEDPNDEHSPVKYFEHVVTMDGEEMHRIKTGARKWRRSNDPVRVFERWLLDDKSCDASNVAHKIQYALGSGRIGFGIKNKLNNIVMVKVIIEPDTGRSVKKTIKIFGITIFKKIVIPVGDKGDYLYAAI